jgi:hypothetical protein
MLVSWFAGICQAGHFRCVCRQKQSLDHRLHFLLPFLWPLPLPSGII